VFPLAVSLLGVIVVVVWRGLPCAESVYPFLPLSSLLFSSLLFSLVIFTASASPYIVSGKMMGNSNPQTATLGKIIARYIEIKIDYHVSRVRNYF
jgi:hypothetical protein